MLFYITKSFLLKGIKNIISHSKESDDSTLNEIRVNLIGKGRDKAVSEEKRVVLQNLMVSIEKLSPKSDEEALAHLEMLVHASYEQLEAICLKHTMHTHTTEASLTRLKENFLIKVREKFIPLQQTISVINKTVYLSGGESDQKDDPLDIFLYYWLYYQIEIQFEEHNAYIGHVHSLIEKKLENIRMHIKLYQESVEDLNPSHREPNKAKTRLLLPRIELMRYQTQEISDANRLSVSSNSFFTPYPDRLAEYLDKASSEIQAQWMIVVQEDLLNTDVAPSGRPAKSKK